MKKSILQNYRKGKPYACHVDQFKAGIIATAFSIELFQELLPNVVGRLCEFIGARQMIEDERGRLVPDKLMKELCLKASGVPAPYYVGETHYRVNDFGDKVTMTFYGQTVILQVTLYVEDMPAKTHGQGLPRIEVRRGLDGYHRSMLQANKAFNPRSLLLNPSHYGNRVI